MNRYLHVHSIFESVSGEAGIFPQGIWCTFIRLQGCNLSCRYCDTKETQRLFNPAHKKVKKMTVEQIVKSIFTRHVIITGGEPLIALHLEDLIIALQETGKQVQVETNGSRILPRIKDVAWIVDCKTPGSGMADKMLPFSELHATRKNVMIKFVICDETDIIYSLVKMEEYEKEGYTGFYLISPVNAVADSVKDLYDTFKLFLDSRLLDRVILSLQIHKICHLP